MRNGSLFAEPEQNQFHRAKHTSFGLGLALAISIAGTHHAFGQTPELVDDKLSVRTVVSGLESPTTMAFLGPNDILVCEKATGKLQRIIDGVIQEEPALDLAVNSASERGLLGIALHPDFEENGAIYLHWTESSTGEDTDLESETPLLGNRVDRFIFDGETLTFDQNIIQLRAIQQDADQRERGNHDGGIIKFGPDGKLYVYIGDTGRRGQMQNLPDGPGPDGNMTDDQFGGPEPDNAHLTGVILRLNDDGTAPEDNPFFTAGQFRLNEEAGANLQKVFAYGIRNGFGMSFDPFSGNLWEAQNGDDTFTELNLVERGANLGWVQIMGPISRLSQFKEIETSEEFFGLQQVRWSPENIADTPEQALARLFHVFEGGDEFGALLTGAEEVPPVTTDASALTMFTLNADGTLSYELIATGPIQDARMAHIHLGAYNQNGPVVVFLYGPTDGEDFEMGDLIASGTITDEDVIARDRFEPSVANVVDRIRQGRAYVNLHTIEHPGGEIRGQVLITDRDPVSHYSDPEFAWKYEVAPAGIGFISSRALGPQYRGDMVVGAARPFLMEGHLFRFNLKGHRRGIAVDDPRLQDGVADNTEKFGLTESETLLFGTGFGIGTDIQTGPNGNLYVVSLTHGAIYEIFRDSPGKAGNPPGRARALERASSRAKGLRR